MRNRADDVRRSWGRTVWFFRIFPIWIGLIVGINVWSDYSDGKPLDPENIWIGLAILGWSGVIYVFSRLIYKFVLRYAEHKDGQIK